MMNPNYEKKVIGRLIRYYRLKKNLSSKELLMMSNGLPVCSVKTLRKLEQGYPMKDYYYDFLAIQLNCHYRLTRDDLALLKEYREALYNCLCHFSKSSMTKLLECLEESIKEYDSFLYFHEAFRLYCDILRYHLYNVMPEHENILFYNDIKEIAEGEDRKIILYYLYQFSNMCTSLNRKMITEECLAYKEDPLFLNCKVIDIYGSHSIFAAYEIIHKLFIETKNHLTRYQQITFYNIIAMIQLNMKDMLSAYETINKALEIIRRDFDFPDQLQAALHMRCAIIAYAMERYEEAVENFLFCTRIHSQRINYNYLLLFHALEKSHQLSLLQKILEDTKTSSFNNTLVLDIFRYYRIKHLQQSALLQKHRMLEELICQNLAPKLVFGELYQKVLVEEMMSHISITRNYKKLYQLYDIIRRYEAELSKKHQQNR